MKIVFFGTPVFAADVLKFLLEQGVDVAAVVSKPDKAKGRSKALVPTPVKEVALDYSIPCFQPEKVSALEFADVLPQFNPDLFVVVAYGEIIKQHILDIPKKGCINLHASLLPKYRGAAPIQRAIIEGEKETGVSIIYLVKKMDAGDILAKEVTAIHSQDTFETVANRLCKIGSRLTLKVIDQIDRGQQQREIQEESLVTYAAKIELEDCQIHWSWPSDRIHNLVRGVNPAPGAWCLVSLGDQVKRLKVFRTEILDNSSLSPAQISYDKSLGLCVGCGEGSILIKELQLEGKRRMFAHELMRGISLNSIRFIF